jgi:acyl transferase domain-containing protein
VKDDDIAIIGVAGRFPGADDAGRFWRNLLDAVDSAGVPTPGITDFDADFFGYDAQQATVADPQHRMFLEVAWEAFEDSGYLPTALTRSIGVFASASLNQYLLLRIRAGGSERVAYQTPDHMPTQVAYRLGARGPAVAVQTACSGSLVAVCLAAQNLLDFRCDFAVAGGSSVYLPSYPHPDNGLASPDGVCRAFDRDAQGAGFGSGAGAVVLRRLVDAEADGDHIHAVLRGWAVTNDGADRAGYAVPGVTGQAAAVAEALAAADLTPADVDFVEAHGSGTVLGDALEVTALRRVFAGAGGRRVLLGSVKTNIGYLDAASGIAGLIKATLAVEHGQVPANLHFSQPNPQVEFAPFVVPTKTLPWPDRDGGGDRVAGVSAFGMGGTNAHVLVSRPPVPPSAGPPVAGPHVLWLSALTPAALRAAATRLGEHLAAHRPPLADVAYTLATGRGRFPRRAAVVCDELEDALAGLARIAAGWCGDEAADPPDAVPPARRVPLPGYPFQRRRYWEDGVEVPA